MLSMKFPHLFLRSEIIITFYGDGSGVLGGGGGGGGCNTALEVQHRSLRNSGINGPKCLLPKCLLLNCLLCQNVYSKSVSK